MADTNRRGIRISADSPEFLLEFDSDTDDFYRGFQCGEIWACLADNVPEVMAIISADNAEMIMRMTNAAGYEFEGRYLSEQENIAMELGPGDWMAVLMRSRYESEG